MKSSKLNILLIEDNPDDQELIQEYLCDGDFNVNILSIRQNLQSGIERLKKKDIDIVLLDLSLPDSFGLDGFKEISANYPEIPVVILTGLSNSESALEAIRVGAQDYLVKGDYDPALLFKTINYAIERNKMITSLFKANLQLKEARSTALQLVNVCNIAREEVEATQSDLQRQKEGLEHFAYVSTHDLRAPVVNLQSLLKFIDRKNYANEQNAVIINKMDITVEQMSETLHDLIEVVAVTKEAEQRKPEVLKLESILNKVILNIEQLVKLQNAKIICDFSKADQIRYVPGHIKSIFQNLVTNAIKYKDPKRDPVINIESTKSNGYTCIKVQDNGCGIDMDKHGKKIFTMFKQLHIDSKGKGLGLYIVKSQIEALGGKIEVESKIGKGTLFTIHLKDQLNGN